MLRATFQLMAAKFAHVFFVPGNHDLWVRRKEREVLDSLGARASITWPVHHGQLLLAPVRTHASGVWQWCVQTMQHNPLLIR